MAHLVGKELKSRGQSVRAFGYGSQGQSARMIGEEGQVAYCDIHLAYALCQKRNTNYNVGGAGRLGGWVEWGMTHMMRELYPIGFCLHPTAGTTVPDVWHEYRKGTQFLAIWTGVISVRV